MRRWAWLLAAVALLPLLAAADVRRDADGLLAVPLLARVSDDAAVLSADERRVLEDRLAAFEVAHGSQIAIIVVPSTQPESIAEFTHRVGDAWKIGRRGIGDGVLITVAVDDRRVWISVARALEGALPDVVAARISREVIAPHFRNGDFGAGLNAALDAIFRQIEGEGLPVPLGLARGSVDGGERVLALLMPFFAVGALAGLALRRLLGVPGALLAAGGTGVVAGAALASILLGGLVGLAVLIAVLVNAAPRGMVRGGRDVFVPRGWSGGGGGRGGGWSSGGGGDFSGGGGGSRW